MWVWVRRGKEAEVWEVNRGYDTAEEAAYAAISQYLDIAAIININGDMIYQSQNKSSDKSRCNRKDYL